MPEDLHQPKHEPGDDHGAEHPAAATPSALLIELREHVPFSVAAVAIGLIVAGAICILGFAGSVESGGPGGPLHVSSVDAHGHADDPAIMFFHLFHPAHMLFSAAATAAMFCRYERRWLKALGVGLIGAIGVCGISDIVFPHVSLMLLDARLPWHICVLEHPELVLPFAVVGVLVGVGAAGGVHRSTIISHTLHVFVSTMASIFYMVGPLGMVEWIHRIGQVFIFVVIAVMVPCCLSDIVFPLLMSKAGRERHEQDPHVH